MSVPIDCIRLIITYARLKERFLWSVTHRDFAFSPGDWQQFGRLYKTREKTRETEN